MRFDQSKCQILHITRSTCPVETQYKLRGQVLEAVSDAKYLGVTINLELNWNKHINNITTKAKRTLRFLRRNLKTRHPGIMEMAYKTLVKPKVEHASVVWSP